MSLKTVTIANGQSDSGAINIEDYRIFAIEMPAAFTGTTLTFKGATSEGATFKDIYDESGTQISITVAVDRIIGLDAAALEISAVTWLKLVSGSSENAERTIAIHMKR